VRPAARAHQAADCGRWSPRAHTETIRSIDEFAAPVGLDTGRLPYLAIIGGAHAKGYVEDPFVTSLARDVVHDRGRETVLGRESRAPSRDLVFVTAVSP
jgi:hypothetical protein